MSRLWLVVGTGLLALSCGGTDSSFGKGGPTGAPGGAGPTDGGAGTGGAAAAGGSTAQRDGSACSQGTRGCSCYGNQTCNAGLVCESTTCVDRDLTGATGGAGGTGSIHQPAAGGTRAGSGGAGGIPAAGGAPASGGGLGAGGAHQCYPENTVCTSDPTGCCLGLRCVSEQGAQNGVCTPTCQSNADCATGCCAPLASGTASVCAPAQYCANSCIGDGGSCTFFPDSCCAGTLCIYDDASNTTASCVSTCTSDFQCVSGCCAPLAGGGSVCSDPSFCGGSSCLPAGTRPCGLGTPCCPDSYCISDSINQICLPTCTVNSDCSTGCCAVPNGNGVHVCTDPSFCP